MRDGILERDWDAIIVGAGLGGGILGRALAEKGLSVLFIEKGRAGWRKEETRIDVSTEDAVARLLLGLWPEPIHVEESGVRRTLFAPLGCGVGGSSVFYAATLERAESHDFNGVWPLSYADMSIWYDMAEALMYVHGEPDPLSDVCPTSLQRPLAATEADAAIIARLRSNGMHPYRLHIALKYLPGCMECLGRKCPRSCKMDGRSAGVEPALGTGRAVLLDNCEVLRLLGTTTQVTGVEVRHESQISTLRARRFILAAGALSTPRVLIASESEAWPRGCGNHADLVGRHLMMHLNEIFAIWPRENRTGGVSGPSRGVGLRDLMIKDGLRLGMVQSLGVDAHEPEILHAIRQRLAGHRLGRTRVAYEAARLPAKVASRLLGTAKLFVGLLEDLPNKENRVVVDPLQPSKIVVRYEVPEELQARRTLFRKSIRQTFRGLSPIFLNIGPEPNWGHTCGTARMGHDPESSVVDANCRVHGIENLWIADASVFPTSMGVNPSLTIAANALRIADGIVKVALT